jgi:hypothetical protein
VTLPAFAIAALGGCSLLLDTSDASDPFAPPPSSEGGADSSAADGAGGGEGEGGGGVQDGGNGEAAAGDGGLACADTLNDDFDTAALGARWDAFNPGSTTMTLDTNDSVSKPASLRLTLPAATESAGAALSKNVPGSKSVCCEWQMRADTAHARVFQLVGEGGDYLLYLQSTTQTLSIGESRSGTPPIVRGDGNWQTDGAWRRIRFDAKLPNGAGKGTLKVHVDSSLAIDTTIGEVVDLSFDIIKLGAVYAQSPSGGTFRFDDVHCSAK